MMEGCNYCPDDPGHGPPDNARKRCGYRNAQSQHNHGVFGVAAGLDSVMPMVKHFDHRANETHGQDNKQHAAIEVTLHGPSISTYVTNRPNLCPPELALVRQTVIASHSAIELHCLPEFANRNFDGGNSVLPEQCMPNRRNFLKGGAAVAFGFASLTALPASATAADNAWIVGPQPGFTPEIGTLTSMLAFTRQQVVRNVQGLSQPQLDFLLDEKANTIGALLLHLAATETYYQLNSFEGMKWGSWPDEVKKKWDIPMNLGESARKAIKGNSLDYYFDALHQAREKSVAEFRKRDDKWLATLVTDGEFSANNYAKWFHVAEHESNHDGQIKFLKSRVPSAKPSE